MSRAFSAERIFFVNLGLGLRALRFTSGCHITGFQARKLSKLQRQAGSLSHLNDFDILFEQRPA